jgi:RHS repeat-associated protein
LLGELREGAWTLFVPLPDSFLLVGALASARSIICVNGHNGQPIRLLDSNGTVVSAPCCTAHGRLLRDRPEALTFAIRFLGQYHDVESDLHYNFRRYYDPHTGRYLTPDPLGYLQDVDLYAYGKNPVNYADPLGLGPHVCYRFLRAAAEDLIDRSAALQRLRSLYGRLDELGEAGLRRELDDLTDWLRRTQGIEVRPVPRGSVFDELMGLSDSNPGRIAGDSTIFIRDDVFATPRRALDEISHEVGAIELNRHFTRAPVIASGPGRAARSRWPTVAEDARYSDLASPRSATHVIDEAVQGDRLSPDHAGSFWNRVHGT